MKKIHFLFLLFVLIGFSVSAQIAYNPFTQNIHFAPEPTAQGFECGSTPSVVFIQGLTTAADATQWQTNPLTVTVCLNGFTFNGPASSVVSGTYASNFNWAYVIGSPNCIIGTQNQTLIGTGGNPAFPNPASTGSIILALKVPDLSPVGTILSVNVTLQVPSYMSFFNSIPDDNESTQTQTFCGCYPLTAAGTIGSDQSFCVSGNPSIFNSIADASGGSGGIILYQWQQLIGSNWTDISGATNSSYDAPSVTNTTSYRRNAKRSLCGQWLNSNPLTVTINSLPVANAGSNVTTTCTTPSATIGTAAIAGNSYSWLPTAGLSPANIAQPTANPVSTTTYTVSVTGSNGCTATSVATVTVDKALPVANAGSNVTTTCTTPSATIGTAAIAGNNYSWLPTAGLSPANIAQPTANPVSNTVYTVTVTGANGCTATSTISVTVNKTPPTASASNATTTCTTPSVMIGTAAISGNSYSWLPTAGLSPANIAQPTANPLSTTTYTVSVTGSNGCTATSVATLTVDKALPVANAGSNVTTTCTTPSATIGTAAISGNSYSWLPMAGLSPANIAQPTSNPVSNTVYTVTVTGANGCTATSTVSVTVNKTPPTASASNATTTCTTPSVMIGTAAISGNSYSWLPTAGLTPANIAQPTANPVSTTTYTVSVTGSNGCTATSVATVTVDKALPVANAGSNVTTTCTTPSATIGTAAISGNSYSWLPMAGLSPANIAQPTSNPVSNTVYTVTVTGANGCTATSTVSVTVNKTPPTASASNATTTCTTPSVMIGTAAISGNSYSWLPAAGLSPANIAQPTANPVSTTTYTVSVTGSNGCTATSVATVTVDKALPVANAGSNVTTTCTTPSATIGTAAISGNSYSWLPMAGLSPANIAQPTANPVSNTIYTVTVTGSNGCTATSTVSVTVDKTPPTASASNATTTCTTPSVMIGTAAISGNSYSWLPTAGLTPANIAQPTANPLSTTIYTVTVTGSNGCTATSVATVTVDKALPVANAGSNVTTTCTTPSATIGTTAIAGNSYSWLPTAGLSPANIAQPTANPVSNTVYTVTVTGSNGCTATSVATVTVDKALPVANAGSNVTTSCTTPSATIGTTSISGNSYSWLPTAGLSPANIAQPTANPVSNTIYTVTVTGANGCTATSTVSVTVDKTPPTASAGPDKVVCSTSTAMIGTTSLAGNGYSWLPILGLSAANIAQPIASPSTTTTYTVTVTGANGCTSSDVVLVDFREGSVGNYVWTDLNADGFNNEASSAGINGVTVQLWTLGIDNQQGTSDDQLYGSTVTANNGGNPGYYNFIVCDDNNYYVKFPLSTNVNDTLTLQTAAAATDNNSDANVFTGFSPIFSILTSGSGLAKDNNTIDAGYILSLSLGNLVWNDADRDGLKATSELGISGATVNVYADANSDGIPDGAAIQTTTTNSNGLYVFNNLYHGNYVIGVVPPAPVSGNPFASSLINETNPNLNVDNNDNGVSTVSGETFSGTITLLGGTEPLGETPNNGSSPDASSNLTVDFGFYQPVNLSGNVFNDITGPANVDGTGTGLPSGTQLFANLVNSAGNVVAVVPVNSNGTYSFTDVTPNTTYSMVLSTTQGTVGSPAPLASLPNGWSNVSEDCCDNTGNDGTTNGITTVVVGTSDVNNINFGIREPLSLGNLVWNDVNKNGLNDGIEAGIAGATVNVYADANSDGIPDGAAIQTTTTNSNGLYVFNGLNAGNYIVGVVPPAVVGGSYTSSAAGQEGNPNLNVDNNDNGVIPNGAETLSGTVVLLPGTEPLGETPNNGTAPDLNSNLTVDFGFYVCPSGFTFTPVYVCPGTTFNLTSIEPVGYTGGVWTTSTGAVVTNTNVNDGTFIYTYQNGTCTASGSVTLSVNVPDYTPIITIAPSAITGISNVRVIINISEILNRSSCSDIYVLIPRLEPRFTFAYLPAATSIGGVAVNNGAWQYFSSNPNFYVWKYVGGSTFPAGGSSKFGYIGSYDPNDTDGETTFSVQIFQGSGGETNLTNNTDSESLIYFR